MLSALLKTRVHFPTVLVFEYRPQPFDFVNPLVLEQPLSALWMKVKFPVFCDFDVICVQQTAEVALKDQYFSEKY